ncbi:MAG: LemA family protein [Hahellaceae bacterium]|nr:LemA family protein [Hahellaceae bacterium]
MKKTLNILLLLLCILIPFSISAWVTPKGFEFISDMRQLERVPPSHIAGIVAGEVNLTARAMQHESLLTSYLTQTPTIYYAYRHEVEETDSDGDSHWVTKESFSYAVDFILQDDTGQRVVRVAENPDRPIDWVMDYATQNTQGSHRYTEWRLEPGEQVFVFARATETLKGLEIGFSQPGQYTPMVSKEGAFAARSGMGASAVWLIWLGLLCLSLSLFALLWLFNVHRVLVFCSVLSLALTLILVHYGLNMMRNDLRAGADRYEQQRTASQEEISKIFSAHRAAWPGWASLGDFYGSTYQYFSAAERERMRDIRLNLGVAHERLLEQRRKFPERLLLKVWSVPEPAAVEGMPEEDLGELNRRKADFVASRVDGMWPYIVAAISSVLMLLFCWLGLRLVKVKRYIENVPTSSTQGVVYGMAEVKGTVKLASESALRGPLTDKDCVWFNYTVEERRGSGKDARWVTIETRKECQAFFCEDREGTLLIDPDEADMISRHAVTRRAGALRYTEQHLCPGDPLYALGFAAVNDSLGKLYLRKEGDDPFILSNYSETELLLRKGRAGLILLDLAFAATLLAGLMLFSASGGLGATDFLQAALLAPLLLTFVMLVIHYNDLVFLRKRVDRAQANIGVSLRKRYNLVPNLVAAVQKYIEHERELQTCLAQWRQQVQQTPRDRIAPDAALEQAERQAVTGLRMVSENYPELKADTLVQSFMKQLSDLETDVALMREGFNDAVTTYNTRRGSFPDMILAKSFGFAEAELN